MRTLEYTIYDVFTDRALTGNPLAVVFYADGLDDATMQAIAREFNLSETIFFQAPQDQANSAKVRIFMPVGELPFAGHPTVGGSVAFAGVKGLAAHSPVVLEEGVGPVHCTVSADQNGGHSSFIVPRISREQPFDEPVGKVAAAMGLTANDIGFSGHNLSLWSAGVPFVMMPVKDVATLSRLTLDAQAWLKLDVHREGKVAAAYIYAPDHNGETTAFRSRMFAPWDGMPEDPATGAAAAAFSGAFWKAEGLKEGTHKSVIHQGVEMGRPSRIELTVEGTGGALTRAIISGQAVKVAQGTMILPD